MLFYTWLLNLIIAENFELTKNLLFCCLCGFYVNVNC